MPNNKRNLSETVAATVAAYLASGGRIAVYAPRARAVAAFDDSGKPIACTYPRPMPVAYLDSDTGA